MELAAIGAGVAVVLIVRLALRMLTAGQSAGLAVGLALVVILAALVPLAYFPQYGLASGGLTLILSILWARHRRPDFVVKGSLLDDAISPELANKLEAAQMEVLQGKDRDEDDT